MKKRETMDRKNREREGEMQRERERERESLLEERETELI